MSCYGSYTIVPKGKGPQLELQTFDSETVGPVRVNTDCEGCGHRNVIWLNREEVVDLLYGLSSELKNRKVTEERNNDDDTSQVRAAKESSEEIVVRIGTLSLYNKGHAAKVGDAEDMALWLYENILKNMKKSKLGVNEHHE